MSLIHYHFHRLEEWMPSRRDKLVIMTELLENMVEPSRLTHILHASNMSYSQLIKYLNSMKAMGLAEEQYVPYRVFRITAEGKTFVDLIKCK